MARNKGPQTTDVALHGQHFEPFGHEAALEGVLH